MQLKLFQPASRQRGISLVELMIGMLLGLILLGGVILVFTSSSETNRNRMAMSAISDNARFTLEHMNRHLRMADPDSIVLDGDILTATLITGNTVTYTLNSADGEITFDDGDGESTLVDGINDWELLFGVGDQEDGTLGYQATAASTDDIWSMRVNLALEDPSDQGNPLEIANNQVGTTIALRNPLLAAIAAQEPVPPSVGAEPETPETPEDPVTDTPPPEDDNNGDDPAPPPPGDDDNSEPGQPIPEQPVACEADTATVSGLNKNADLRGQTIVAGQGAFLGCDDSGTTRQCSGRATSQQGFSVNLTFRQGNQSFDRVVDFSCVR